MRRRSFLVPLGVLLACLVALPDRGTTRAADPAPATVASDYPLFAHLNMKGVRDSALFTEVKQAFTKSGTPAEWDKMEEQVSKNLELGVKPTDLDSVTVCLAEVPERGAPQFVLILASGKPVSKVGAFGLKPDAKPDARGFYQTSRDFRVHFADDKTVAILHTDLEQKYLDGYAKNRTGWPFTADLSKAVAGHMAFVSLRPDKFPDAVKKERNFQEFGPLLAARAVTLTVDLKGKELSLAARATFANPTAAGKAKHKAHALVSMLSDEVDKLLGDKAAAELGPVLPAVKEFERALAALKVDADGSDLTASASYKADFDFGVLMTEGVKKVRESAARSSAVNNFKQIGLAMHTHASADNDKMPVHGIGAKGMLLKKDEKPLLSWRVAMLPYIEEDALYKQFKLDEPWDSENNKKLIDKMPKVYAPVGKPGKPGYTHMQMVIGPKAMRPPFASLRTSFPDGTSNTVMLVEAAEPVIWTKPDDVMFPDKELPKGFKKKFGGQFSGGFHVALWDGSVRFVSDAVTERTLGFALCPDDGQVLGSDW